MKEHIMLLVNLLVAYCLVFALIPQSRVGLDSVKAPTGVYHESE